MSAFHDSALIGASGQGAYQIERSLRFNSADSSFLSTAFTSAGNRKTWTWAGWVKRSTPGVRQGFFSCQNGLDNASLQFGFMDDDGFQMGNGSVYVFRSSAVFRDLSAWQHWVIAVDTTLASNRCKIYVNGVQVTTWSTDIFDSTFAQNSDTAINQALVHYLGQIGANLSYLDGYLADVHFCDGYAYDPSYFTEFDDNGILQPIAFTGSYGANGFHLPLNDNSTAAALGTDTSGNGNTWTVNNISVAAGAGNDSLVDSPTNYGTDTGAGNEVRGNYCTLNPLNGSLYGALTNGNLDYNSTVYSTHRYGTIGVSSGKWYWETTLTSTPSGEFNLYGPGISDNPLETGATYTGIRIYIHSNGDKFTGATSTQSAYGASFTNGDVIGVALDLDAGTLVFYKNGVSQGTAFSGLTGTWFPLIRTDATASGAWNFGQRPFAYPVSGFKALTTANLPTPTIADGSTAMDVALYTGNGGTQTISGLGFSPDLVWIKGRVSILNHVLSDTVRGANLKLASNTTDAEAGTDNGTISAFNSDGFTVEMGGGPFPGYETNQSGFTYVAWTWDAGNSTVTNNDGTITSQVRANPSAGFSIVKFNTGSSSPFTVGHGLGIKPALIIDKAMNTGAWSVYHSALGATKFLRLNTTDAADTQVYPWGNTEPTSTVFTGADLFWWGTNFDHIAYCFAPVEGYSAFGSYIGNGSADGPFVYTGFRVKFYMYKRADTTGSWIILDADRPGYNVVDKVLSPNLTNAESTYNMVDFCSNGIKIRNNVTADNGSGGTFLYCAFAENPFSLARAR